MQFQLVISLYLKAHIRDLAKRLEQAEMEKEILKKATAYFASQKP